VKKEVKHTQQELARREKLLRDAVIHLPSTFIVYDNKGRIEYINEYSLILSDLSAKEAIGKREEDILPPEITQKYLPFLYGF
jgi:PAS domain S-box-containing protein